MSNFGIFYNARSLNMAMSRDPRKNFEKNLHFPNSTFNIGKSCKISSRKALYFRSYQPKTSRGGGKHPPSAFTVNMQQPCLWATECLQPICVRVCVCVCVCACACVCVCYWGMRITLCKICAKACTTVPALRKSLTSFSLSPKKIMFPFGFL